MADQLEADNITKRFGTLSVLESLTFSVARGQLVAIVGPSGCGKTTFLKIAAGLEAPTTGSLSWQGLPISESIAFGAVGYISQKPVLLPWRTASENIGLPLELLSSRTATKADLDVIIRSVQLENFETYLPSKLSGGMKQRVALGRLLVHRPSLILMDEPFSELDERTREEMASLTVTICRELRSTVLFVTHQLSEAILMADRILVFSGLPGKLIGDIKVALPRPRPLGVQVSNTYLEIQTCLRHLLNFNN